jgi:hypothetical protein
MAKPEEVSPFRGGAALKLDFSAPEVFLPDETYFGWLRKPI